VLSRQVDKIHFAEEHISGTGVVGVKIILNGHIFDTAEEVQNFYLLYVYFGHVERMI
jgi:hypothetical protein